MNFEEEMGKIISQAKLTKLHWKIWFLSAMGLFIEGFDLFIISIAFPLIIIEFEPGTFSQALIASSAVIGMIFGAFIGGIITDKIGRRGIYVIDIFIFIVFSLLSAFSWNSISLIIFRFFLGIGIGADYPICASYISEFMPSRVRGKMLISAFAFQAFGILSGALIGLLIIKNFEKIDSWRFILASASIPAIIISILRRQIFESPLWLMKNNKAKEAIEVISVISNEKKDCLEKIYKNCDIKNKEIHGKWIDLFSKKYLHKTLLSSVPWFLMDIATYGIGLFIPILLGQLFLNNNKHDKADFLSAIYTSVDGATFLDVFLILGFTLNLLLVEKLGRIRLQIIGFLGMSLGLGLLVFADNFKFTNPQLHLAIVYFGFIVFNLLMNMGPNATTFTIPAEVFPTEMRGAGHGFAAGCAKIGAFLGIFLMPFSTEELGIKTSLIILSIFCFIGMLVTIIFKIETKGKVLR
jgi:putative MFS transporter